MYKIILSEVQKYKKYFKGVSTFGILVNILKIVENMNPKKKNIFENITKCFIDFVNNH